MAAEGSGPSAWILQLEAEFAGSAQVALQTGQQGGIGVPAEVGKPGQAAAADLGKQFADHPFGGVEAIAIQSGGHAEEEGGREIERFAAQHV